MNIYTIEEYQKYYFNSYSHIALAYSTSKSKPIAEPAKSFDDVEPFIEGEVYWQLHGRKIVIMKDDTVYEFDEKVLLDYEHNFAALIKSGLTYLEAMISLDL